MIVNLHRTRHAALIGALVACGFAVQTANAQTSERVTLGEDVVVREGEVHDGPLTVIQGDLRVEEGAIVEGDVVTVDGSVDVVGEVDGDVAVWGGDARIDGDVAGDVAVLGGEADIAGRVDGDIMVAGDVNLGPEAVVTGSLRAGGKTSKARGAVVIGEVVRGGPFAEGLWSTDVQPPSGPALALAAVLALLLPAAFAALLAAVAPRPIRQVTSAIHGRAVVATVLGGLVWVAVPILSALALPLAPILLAVFAVLLAVGFTGVAAGAGRHLGAGESLVRRAGIGAAVLALPVVVGTMVGPWLGGDTGRALFVVALFWLACLAAASAGAGLLLLGQARRPSVPSEGAGAMPTALLDVAPEPPTVASTVPASAPVAAGADPMGPSAIDPATASASVAAAVAALPDAEDEPAPVPPVPLAPPSWPENPSLRDVPGVTPLYAFALEASGIASIDALAAAEPERVRDIVATSGLTPITTAQAADWVAAAARRIGG